MNRVGSAGRVLVAVCTLASLAGCSASPTVSKTDALTKDRELVAKVKALLPQVNGWRPSQADGSTPCSETTDARNIYYELSGTSAVPADQLATALQARGAQVGLPFARAASPPLPPTLIQVGYNAPDGYFVGMQVSTLTGKVDLFASSPCAK